MRKRFEKAYHESKKMTLELGEEGQAGGGGGQDLNYIQKIKICIYIRLLDSNKREIIGKSSTIEFDANN